ncbi:MAG: HAMP domain-containing sensor histidine kinase [Ginsengibacter sp.]
MIIPACPFLIGGNIELTLGTNFHDVVAEMQLTTRAHTISVKLVKTVSMYGERNRLGQVLTNLLANAIKYSNHTHNTKVASKKDEQFVSITVKDFGIGVSKEKQDKIFKRFFRVSGIKDDTYPGLGLGLYISSEIVKHHKGIILVKSIEGKGATFSINLPLKKQANSKKQLAKQSA